MSVYRVEATYTNNGRPVNMDIAFQKPDTIEHVSVDKFFSWSWTEQRDWYVTGNRHHKDGDMMYRYISDSRWYVEINSIADLNAIIQIHGTVEISEHNGEFTMYIDNDEPRALAA